jgi:hypothetical protein
MSVKLPDGGEQRVSPACEGATVATAPLVPRAVGFVCYIPGSPLEIVELEPGDAALRLLEHMPSMRERPEMTLQIAARLTSGARCAALRHGDSLAASDALIRWMEES